MPDNQDPASSGERAPKAIREANSSAPLPKATPPQDGPAYPRPFVNAQSNARLSTALPAGLWEARWQAPLDPFFPYAFVLQAGNRIMLQGPGRWQLFDLRGTSLAIDNFGDSDIVLDAERSLAYLADRFGRGLAVQLMDAVPAFIFSLEGTGDYRRTFLDRQGDRMVAASFKRPTNPHDPVPPRISVVEIYDLGNPPRVTEGVLLSAVRRAVLYYEVETLLAAVQNGTLVLALPNRIVRTDLDLTIQDEFEGPFTPLAMSLDETGRAYLVVRIEEEEGGVRHALWVVTPEGDRVIDVEVPEAAYGPPVVGYDHRVYLAAGDSIRAFEADGEARWTRYAGGPVAGAVVTADDRLLVAAGGLLAAYDAAGERTVLFNLEGDRWTTPPVLTERNRIFVASEQHLYCLGIKQ